jgi:hypothetical protein
MIALYFILFVIIISALMLGSGATDPVTRLFEDNWDAIKREVYAGNPVLYEQQCTSAELGTGTNCLDFFGEYKSSGMGVGCLEDSSGTRAYTLQGDANSPGRYGINCTMFDEEPGNTNDCGDLKDKCDSCEAECKAMLIAQGKDKNVAACIFAILLTLFMIAVVALHTFARAGFYKGGDTEAPCCKGMGPGGWLIIVLNLVFSCLGLVVMIMAVATVKSPVGEEFDVGEGFQSGALWVFLLLIGLVLWLIPVFQILLITTHKQPNYVCDCVVMVLIFVMMLFSAFLGFLSGALVNDVNSSYDENYDTYRAEIELYDNTYCQLSESDCAAVTADTSGTHSVYPVSESDRPDDMAKISSDDLWDN